MLRILLAIGCVTAPLLAQPSGVGQSSTPARPKVLAFFTSGGELDHVLFAQQAMRVFVAAEAGGYAFAATSDWDALNEANLRDVRVVIWLNDMPHTAAQRLAFERYMEGGGGWLGFHFSGFGSTAWPWFTAFMGGGRFSASNWPALPARVNADDPTHPILKGVPATFVAPINEWYAWTPSPRANPDVKVLLTLDGSNFPLGVKNTLNGGDIPVAWMNTRYRMVYVNYGHGDQIYSTPPLPTMIDNTLRWLLARETGAAPIEPGR
jgi:type 1 glutamine amidotransferase